MKTNSNNTKYRVLFVEDDRIDQTAFQQMVKDEGLPYNYAIAGSVSEAKSMLGSERFDVAIVDHFLGDGTAFDVLDSAAETPVIFATGAGDEGLAVKAMKAGACDYIIKDPVHNYLKVLPELVKNAIKHKKAELELKGYHDSLEKVVKERTEQLAKEKELLSVTLSSMGDGLIAVDDNKCITLFNDKARELTGLRFENVTGKPIDEIFYTINEKTKRNIESPIDKVLRSGKIEESGAENDALITKDGRKCLISATAAPINNNDGTMIGAVMVFRDVSKEREVDRLKNDFISSVSHELRTPLTSIKAYTETILHDTNAEEDTRTEFLNIINEESDRLANLIESLLEISRIDSGTAEIVRELVNIPSIIQRVVVALEPLANKNNIQLKTDIDEDICEFNGDEQKIMSAITNLVNNAIKFTLKGGEVSVTACRQNDELVIRIVDTGMGIPKEVLPKLFDRFYRVYRPGIQIQGTGLGLAIVKEIILMHSGRIEVESEVDHGTTFTVFLPLNELPQEQVACKSAKK
ncbi:MAG: sensor histidine kinase [Planctomycetota bacterium]|jgi:PAS domain S-box-containing protein